MSKASHYPTLNIHVEACGTSEMGYYKRLSHVREQEKHGAHLYGIYMYRKSLEIQDRIQYNTVQEITGLRPVQF